jgi:hypothetical protein
MDNPEKLATLGTQDTGQRLEKTKGTIKNGQSRETVNIEYTRNKTKTNTILIMSEHEDGYTRNAL